MCNILWQVIQQLLRHFTQNHQCQSAAGTRGKTWMYQSSESVNGCMLWSEFKENVSMSVIIINETIRRPHKPYKTSTNKTRLELETRVWCTRSMCMWFAGPDWAGFNRKWEEKASWKVHCKVFYDLNLKKT